MRPPTGLRRRLLASIAAGTMVLACGSATTAPATATAAAPARTTHTVTIDQHSVMLDGSRVYLWSGEFHYWRLPSPDLWLDVLQKMKAAGYNATSIYFDWAYHSPKPGVYDFAGTRDIDELLDIAQEVGIYVIARPGPYINAETDSGGFPGWLTTQQGRARSSAPDYTAAYQDWLRHVDPIIARHQLTNGTGTVILYQIENEYGSNTDPAYMQDIERQARADGVTVPFSHNHCCDTATWANGPGAVDLPGQDSYPQGFNCSNPSAWNGVDTLPRLRSDTPVFAPEYQGGSFDPWGGPGYDKCRELTGSDFENVFYQNNIASGSTAQNFYMTYGGTSWGWLADPQQVYSSYDYGAAIKEDRELTPKYDTAKELAYFTQSVAPLTKTDPIVAAPPDNAALSLAGRVNTDDNTHVYVLRHRNSTSTTTETTHIPIDLNAVPPHYTFDDTDASLSYAGDGWSHVANQSFTGGDYENTESFSDQADASMTVTFTGTAVRWISSHEANHGIADVFLDGAKVATVDGYAPSKSFQDVFYAADGLANATHTLKIVATGTKNPASAGSFVVVDAIDLSPGTRSDQATYPSVPQQPGTAITLAGRDSRLLLAGYRFGSQQLRYSTSELMTAGRIGDRDVALFHGRAGTDGETVLHYAAEPQVTVLSGAVQHTFDAGRGDLRLDYTHQGPARVLVTPRDGVPVLLLLATDEQAATFWRQDTAAGPVLARGPELLRTATSHGAALALTGDTTAPTDLEIFAPPAVQSVTWNGVEVPMSRHDTLTGRLPGPRPVTLPSLTNWVTRPESPEADPAFDDSGWRVADKMTTANPTPPVTLPVLYADEYGFHHGDVWYRGHFTATGGATGVNLSAVTGRAGIYSVWLNGTFLGSSDDRGHVFGFPADSVRAGQDNVVSVLVENMGHNEDFNATDSHKEPRGLTGAALAGSSAPLSWRVQGSLGGETPADSTRGPFNTGGLFGERNGWYLPGPTGSGWTPATLPHRDPTPGVAWYRTTFALHLPKDQDVPLGVTLTDDPSRHYRALLYVNGWQFGRYINDVGPEHTFPVPPGILHTDGTNTIAIAVWNEDGSTGGLGQVSLQQFANLATSLKVRDVTAR